MRIVLQVFTTLMLVSMLLGSLMMAQIDGRLATRSLMMHDTGFSGEPSQPQIGAGGHASGRWYTSCGIWLLLAVGSLWGVVATFLRKHALGMYTGIGLLALTVLGVLYQPSGGDYLRNDPKYTGMGIAFFGLVGMLMLIALHTVFKPKTELQAAKPLTWRN